MDHRSHGIARMSELGQPLPGRADSRSGSVRVGLIATDFCGAIKNRNVPVAAIEDDGTILYSILTFSLPDASPKVYPG
jgi:hypothetical protein